MPTGVAMSVGLQVPGGAGFEALEIVEQIPAGVISDVRSGHVGRTRRSGEASSVAGGGPPCKRLSGRDDRSPGDRPCVDILQRYRASPCCWRWSRRGQRWCDRRGRAPGNESNDTCSGESRSLLIGHPYIFAGARGSTRHGGTIAQIVPRGAGWISVRARALQPTADTDLRSQEERCCWRGIVPAPRSSDTLGQDRDTRRNAA